MTGKRHSYKKKRKRNFGETKKNIHFFQTIRPLTKIKHFFFVNFIKHNQLLHSY